MMGKLEVVGNGADPLFKHLQAEAGEQIDWNFAKYLINSEGKLVKFYKAPVDPKDMMDDISTLLA